MNKSKKKNLVNYKALHFQIIYFSQEFNKFNNNPSLDALVTYISNL